MHIWEKVIQEFIEPYRENRNIEAAILTGSYAIGLQNKKSDVDIYFISSTRSKWRERGNKYNSGYLIEYFINPATQIFKEMDESIKDGDRVNALIFNNGIILFDKTNIIKTILKRAKKDLKIRLQELNEAQIATSKYEIWDFFEELERAYSTDKEEYLFLYYLFLEHVLVEYCKFLRVLLPTRYKVIQYLKEEIFSNRHGLDNIPDKQFIDYFIRCLSKTTYKKSFQNAYALKEYTLKTMGGFEINGLRILEKSNK
jgi:hypothetical protein